MSPDQIVRQLEWRYATKVFNPSRKISAADWAVLEQALILAPSSYGLQPWKFVIITNPELKDRLPEAAWNQSQPRDCSHFVVIAARKATDVAFVDQLIARTAEQRGQALSSLAGYRQAILGKTAGLKSGHQEWNARQCYIALGFLLEAAALMEIDACPMEGIIPDRMDELLGLQDSGYTSVVACALGYRADTDKYASQKKVRYTADEVTVHIQ